MYLQQLPPHQRRISGFLLLAIVLHAAALVGFWDHSLGLRPELPQWVNIKLVAGLDISPQEVPRVKPRQPVVKPKAKIPPAETGMEPAAIEQAEETVMQETKAQHFVQADSRPFAHENPRPVYPATARRRGMQGTVLLRVAVGVTGRVTRVELIKSSRFRILDRAAISCVRRWRFIPARRNDEPVESVVEIPIRFSLKG